MTAAVNRAAALTGTLPAQDPTPPGGGDGGGGGLVSNLLGGVAGDVAQSAFSDAMQAVWDGAIWLLKGAFDLADKVSQVNPSTITGRTSDVGGLTDPGGATSVDVSSLWSSMIWLAAMIALGLFFYQLITVALRGGRGMFRAVTGPAQFGIALAVTTGAVAILLTAADGLTQLFLSSLSEQSNFTSALDNPIVADRFGENPDLGEVEEGVRSMVLGLAAVFGVIPAAVGFALQMIFRAAAIMVLIAAVPVAAACLAADTTASVFWRTVRWIFAAVLMKPALALVLVIGVNVMARAEGVAGLLAGTAVLLVSLFCPMVLYRLLAFVDPGTGAGMAVRSFGSSIGSGSAGSDGGSSEAINVARQMQSSGGAGGGGELGGSTASTGAAGRAAGIGAGGSAAGSAGGGAAAGAGGGSAAAGGAAAGIGAAGGVAGAAIVGGYLATKAAGQAAGGYASSQMAQTGIGHPGPAPGAGAGGGQIGSAAGGAYSSATTTSDWSGQAPTADAGPVGSGPDGPDGPPSGSAPDPPPVDPGPPDAGAPGPAESASSQTSWDFSGSSFHGNTVVGDNASVTNRTDAPDPAPDSQGGDRR
ncbi:PE family protein [Pseudonocardia sp. Ae168_Ps1]|uniref:hypothetical protein n=1 Tax=unclassified Pseudonocardia TaxID=2619320 RepID=UPI00094B3F28|nr:MULTISPECIES: hypothetical protein [unclassified Pseudonocardia]OLL70505.1 PE family protein [Pseudonocardia sp. Ae168_Ps1]OLL71526.1 hypothetical protein Ae263Ps1_6014c [Pseudonocardia sp. Ae263_Ps1]